MKGDIVNIRHLLKKIMPVSYQKLEAACENYKQEALSEMSKLRKILEIQNVAIEHLVDLNLSQKEILEIQQKKINEYEQKIFDIYIKLEEEINLIAKIQS